MKVMLPNKLCTHMYTRGNKHTQQYITLSLSLSQTHTHVHTDGLMEAFIDWATGQREDTAVVKYMPK